MRLRACAALLLFLSACATSAPGPRERASRNPRIANLQRAATLPWTDGGRCAVREASQPWPVLAERCYQVLDHDRVRFNDRTGRCAVASAGAAALGIGLCDDFEKQPPRSQRFFVRMKLPGLRLEAKLARECGYDFIIGVRSAAHKAVLFDEGPTLKAVVMDWC